MKTRCTIGGGVVGLLFGVGVIVFAFTKAPGLPSAAELLLLAVVLIVFTLPGALAGMLLGWLLSRRERPK